MPIYHDGYLFAISDFHPSRHSGGRHIENMMLMKRIKGAIPIQMCTNEHVVSTPIHSFHLRKTAYALHTCVCSHWLHVGNHKCNTGTDICKCGLLSLTLVLDKHIQVTQCTCILCHPSNSTYKEYQNRAGPAG